MRVEEAHVEREEGVTGFEGGEGGVAVGDMRSGTKVRGEELACVNDGEELMELHGE